MAERNYLKTEAVFLTEKTPKKEVVVTPPLREDSLTVTENGTYQAPIGRGYTDVNVNVQGAEPLLVTLTKNQNDEYFTADKTNAEIAEAVVNKTAVYLKNGDSIFVVNMLRIIDPTTGESRFKATIPNFGLLQTYADTFDNTTWEAIEDPKIYWVNLTWDDYENGYIADKTNGEIAQATISGLIPYVNYQLNDLQFANFRFTSPILLVGIDNINGLYLFQSQMYNSPTMGTLYSDRTLPTSTNTLWHMGYTDLASELYVDESVCYQFNLTQQTSNSSNSFECSESAGNIIYYCAHDIGVNNDGLYRIPFININYYNNTDVICTRNLEVCNDGTLYIIYYDPKKTGLYKLTHLPTDGDIIWTRSAV